MSTKRIILHIGDAKTGTSSIQNYLKYNRKILEENDILYPRTGLMSDEGIAQHKLAFCMNTDRPEDNKYLDKIYNDLFLEIDKAKCSTVIISSEGFSSLRSYQEIEKLKNFLIAYNVEIVAYLRRPDLWIESWYAQIVKNRPFITKTFGEYLTNHQEPSLSTILKYADVFGDKNILIRPFEKERMLNNNLIEDFFNITRLRLVGNVISDINKTPDIYVTELIRHLNEKVRLPLNLRMHLNNELVNNLKLSNKNKYFSINSRVAFLKKYDDIISEINNRLFNGDKLFSYPSYTIDYSEEDKNSLLIPKLNDITKYLDNELKK